MLWNKYNKYYLTVVCILKCLSCYLSVYTSALLHTQRIFSLAKQINYCSHEYSPHTKFKQTVSMVARRIPNDKTERVIERDISGNIYSVRRYLLYQGITRAFTTPQYGRCIARSLYSAEHLIDVSPHNYHITSCLRALYCTRLPIKINELTYCPACGHNWAAREASARNATNQRALQR